MNKPLSYNQILVRTSPALWFVIALRIQRPIFHTLQLATTVAVLCNDDRKFKRGWWEPYKHWHGISCLGRRSDFQAWIKWINNKQIDFLLVQSVVNQEQWRIINTLCGDARVTAWDMFETCCSQASSRTGFGGSVQAVSAVWCPLAQKLRDWPTRSSKPWEFVECTVLCGKCTYAPVQVMSNIETYSKKDPPCSN